MAEKENVALGGQSVSRQGLRETSDQNRRLDILKKRENGTN